MAVSYTFFNESFTGGDTGKPITTDRVTLTGCDIMVLDFGADIGGRLNQSTELSVGDILSYGAEIPVELSQIWFKNHSAGSNCVLSVTGWIVD